MSCSTELSMKKFYNLRARSVFPFCCEDSYGFIGCIDMLLLSQSKKLI